MAAPYNWGGTLKAPLPVNGQVWVDLDFHVWQWSADQQAWNRAPHIELQRIHSRMYAILARPAGYDFIPFEMSNNAPKPGRLGEVWDSAYELSFVEVRSTSGTLYGRRAHMSRADLLAWVGTIVPLTLGGEYDDNIILTVYEAVDVSVDMPKWSVWNNLYASFRGRECYFGANGYGRPGLPQIAGYSPYFTSYSGIELGRILVQHFFGQNPVTDEPLSCWTTRGRHGLYNHPNANTARIVANDGGSRMIWNTSVQAWQPSVMGQIFIHDTTTISYNPALVYRAPGESALVVEDIRPAVRGISAVLGHSNNGREGLVVRAMQDQTDANLHGFVVKPYGVTEAAFNTAADMNADLMALPDYKACAKGSLGVANLSRLGLVEDRGERGIRFNLSMMYVALKAWYGSPWQFTHDNPIIPERVRFYLRDRVTGVRCSTSSQYVYTERRRSCIPVGLMFRHA